MAMDPTKDPMLKRLSKKSKGYAKNMDEPEELPNAVCFPMPGAELSHQAVWQQLEKDVLSVYPEVKVVTIKYVPRDLLINRPKGSDPIDNRWVVTVNSEWSRKRITGMWLRFEGRPVQLKGYDDVMGSEYRQFTRMKEYMKDFKVFEKRSKKKQKKRKSIN